MMLPLRLVVGGAVTFGVWLLLAGVLAAFGGVGIVELAILFTPALAAGVSVYRALTQSAR